MPGIATTTVQETSITANPDQGPAANPFQPVKGHRNPERASDTMGLPTGKTLANPKNFSTSDTRQSSVLTHLQKAAQERWGSKVAVHSKRPGAALDKPAIWPSSKGHGFGACMPNALPVRVPDLDAAHQFFLDAGIGAAHQKFADKVNARWAGNVVAVEGRPIGPLVLPAIWKSEREPGSYEFALPGGGEGRAKSLQAAAAILEKHGVLTRARQQALTNQLEFNKDVRRHWGDDVLALEMHPEEVPGKPAIWKSSQLPGSFNLYIPGSGTQYVRSLEDAAGVLRSHGLVTRSEREEAEQLAHFRAQARSLLGPGIQVLAKRPSSSSTQPAVWQSKSQPGAVSVHLPDGRNLQVASLEQAVRALTANGVRLRTGSGENITLRGPGLPAAERVALEQRYGVAITPIAIDGKEIAFRIGRPGGAQNPHVFLSCHGSATNEPGVIRKPPGLHISFAAPSNMILRSTTMGFARALRDGTARFPDPTQVYDANQRAVTNYRLSGNIHTTAKDIAAFTARMSGRSGNDHRFDTILLNRDADNVRLGDLLQGLADTLPAGDLRQLTCHFCRGRNADALDFFPPIQTSRGKEVSSVA